MHLPRATTFGLLSISAAAFTMLALGVGDTAGHDGIPAEPPAPAACGEYADGYTPTNTLDGVCYLPTEHDGYPTISTADYGTDIPRCATDDSNTTGLARCYTEGSGFVVIIDADDTTIGTID